MTDGAADELKLTDVVFFPERTEGEVGVYSDDLKAIVKQLRAEGVEAGYLHEAEHREWVGRRGVPLLVPFVIGIASSFIGTAAWVAFARILKGTFGQQRLSVRYGKLNDDRSGIDGELFQAEGNADDVIKAIEKLRADTPTE
jgi:hypothetical protein